MKYKTSRDFARKNAFPGGRRSLLTPMAIILVFVCTLSCNESDPSPTPTNVDGRVVFWTHVNDNIGNIEVTLNGIKQTCTKVTSDFGPACGQSGFATFQNSAGTYSFTAQELTAPSRKWSGNVVFITNQCEKWQLKLNVGGSSGNTGGTGSTASTITFKNNSWTTMDITFGGVAKAVLPGGSGVFTGQPNTPNTGQAVTSGKTSNGTQVGLKLSWDLAYSFPSSGNANVDINVKKDYFFLYVTNNSINLISKVYVNYGLQSQTLDNVSLPNNGTKYSIGYYKAWSNSSARFETGNGSFYWSYSSLPLSFVDNQSVSLIAN